MRYLSLFSGLEAAHVATSPLGWQCVGVSEIDPNACAILAHRLPGVPNLGSVTDITDEQIAALGRIDVVIGGSPCQDLSVAGKRAGLGGARSSLFHEQLRIFHAARTLCGARWLVWENVPGAFSSNAGRDFAVVVGALAGCSLDVPADGWGSEGVALGDNGLVEWAVLDSQWFGVAQRRRRVFAVLDAGEWASRSPVLLERDSLRGDSAPRREAGEGVAGTIADGSRGSGGYSTDDAELIPETVGALTDGAHNGGGSTGRTLTPDASLPLLANTLTRRMHKGINTTCDEGQTLIPTTGAGFDVAHTLRADGFDASEDGTGRGTPLVPVALRGHSDYGDGLPSLRASGGDCAGGSEALVTVAFSCKDHGADAGDTAPTLRAMGHSGSHANAGGQVAVAFNWQSGGDCRGLDPQPTTNALHCGQTPAALHGMAVRRLTPRECERLQSLPDDWTLVPNAKGKPMADGPRYKALGNTFTATVIRWIARQIQMAHEQSRAAA